MSTTAPSQSSSITPLMQQYLQVKSRFPNEILFFRLGDFYEMFFEDAIRAAPVLEVALTKRQTTPMCGIPHHAATGYIAKLLKAGISVAVAEQLEDPKKTKGMVKRDVVRIITPGTILDEELLESKANNFLVALSSIESGSKNLFHWALVAADISTGEQWTADVNGDAHLSILKSQLASLRPSEVLFIGDAAKTLAGILDLSCVVRFEPVPAESTGLLDQSLRVMKNFLVRDRVGDAPQLREPKPLPVDPNGVLFLDETAIRHLELIEPSDPSRGGPTLLSLLDTCLTPIGSRLLRWWLLHPLTDIARIQERLDMVDGLADLAAARDELKLLLREISDIERIVMRTQAGTASPRDVAALRNSLQKAPELARKLSEINKETLSKRYDKFIRALQVPEALMTLLTAHLTDEPPAKVIDGHVIRDGVNASLDELRSLRRDGKKWIAQMEADEREKTGIGSLKVGYNDIFGYYLDVSRTNLSKVPADWIRKQTMANGERYITPALKEQEEKILGAEQKILEIETALFNDLLHQAAAFAPTLMTVAEAIASVDAILSLAHVAADRHYVRPKLANSDLLNIKGGRHPVIEKQIGRDRFIPNDIRLGDGDKHILVITGPNMAGKSTYLRQVALIAIMAQMGSFVPAEEAEIGIVDRIFTRIGASDRLSQGQSTFMVEMSEVASLLLNATNKSLLILDEVGRGTSTYDGVSIAWAVIDYLVKGPSRGARTLFATHYFELTQLADDLPGVFNAHATAKEWTSTDGKRQVVFLYQIQPGPADRSYGIHVAQMAGLPDSCIDRAREILKHLETGDHNLRVKPGAKKNESQLEFFGHHPAIQEIRNLHVEQMTPLEALNALAKIKKQVDDE